MTKAEKIKRLRKAKIEIQGYYDNRCGMGICYALNITSELTFADFGIRERPCNVYGLHSSPKYWFSLDKKGDKKRIAILDAAIKRLSPKKKR